MTDGQSFGKRRRTREGRDARKRELLAAARALFVEEGYERTSVAAIVRRAGVAQGTFYLYFEGKEQVLVHLRARVLFELMDELAKAIRRDEPADVRLVEGIRALERGTRRNRALFRVFRQATTGEETELVWIRGREALTEPLAGLIREGVADGRFTVDSPDMAAYLALVLFDDLLYEAMEFKKPAGPRKTRRLALRFLLHALRADPRRVDALVP